jgi:release factor glutamine methyltransferase
VTALKVAQEILSANSVLLKQGQIANEAEQIVRAAYEHHSGKELSRMDLYARAEDRITSEVGEQVLVMAGARAQGKLLQHVTGSQYFYKHNYKVSPQVLVPRPETEILIHRMIEILSENPPQQGFEIGLGSGILSIELLAKFPGLKMVATEASDAAAEVAIRNAEKILTHPEQLMVIPSKPDRVFEAFPFQGADFLISNPPYLVKNSGEVEEDVAAQEPAIALYAPEGNPFFFYQQIASQASRYVRSGGWVGLEIPHERAEVIAGLFLARGSKFEMVNDLNGRPRALFVQLV